MLARWLPLLLMTLSLALPAQAEQIRLQIEPGQALLPEGKVQKTYIRIGLEGFAVAQRQQRPPINVALVLDRSGSMGGDKIAQAKQAALKALDYLQPDDTLALVIYDDQIEVLSPSAPFRDRQKVERAIRGIEVKGRTALHGGVSKGAEELRKFVKENRVNRLLLLSDGLANVGPSTPAELGELGRVLGGEGISVTTIGLGLDYNEDLMVRLAGASDGNHAFVEKPSQLAGIFGKEFGELISVVAREVIIIIHCPHGVKPLRSLGREARIEGQQVEARLGQLYASQEKYLLLEVEVPAGQAGNAIDLADVEVRYQNLISQGQDQLRQQARVGYSANEHEVESSLNAKVMVAASEQIGAQMDEEALRSKDQGDAAGASKLLRDKAAYLESQGKRLKSEKLMQQSASTREMEQAVAAPAGSADWNKARKTIRADQYSIKKQQSYK